MKTTIASAIALIGTAGTVLANTTGACNPALGQCSTSVPEISALEGTAALAALAAIVLLAWERRRRAA